LTASGMNSSTDRPFGPVTERVMPARGRAESLSCARVDSVIGDGFWAAGGGDALDWAPAAEALYIDASKSRPNERNRGT
jgi:hypothetical protein